MGESKYNNFIREYQTIREVLKELFIYGCYKDVKIIKRLHISSRKLEKEFQRLHFYTEMENRNERNIKHSKIYGFRYDCYTNNNYLYDTYRLKTMEMNYFNRYILILQILNQYHKAEIKELNDLSDGRLNCDTAAINKMINEMVDLGVVCRNKEKKNIVEEMENIFDCLSENELFSLKVAAELYEKMIPCSVIGYFFRNSIEQYLKQQYQKEYEIKNICIFGYDFLYKTLNDEVMHDIMEAMKEENEIEAEESNTNKRITIYPLKLIEEYLYGRQYLYGVDLESKKGKCWRIEKIRNLKKKKWDKNEINKEEIVEERKKIEKSWCIGVASKKKKPEEIVIEFQCAEGEEYIFSRLEKEKQWGQISYPDKRTALLEIEVNQSREMIPWIRSFGKHAKVLKGEKLKQDLKQSWEEMLKEYESFSEE